MNSYIFLRSHGFITLFFPYRAPPAGPPPYGDHGGWAGSVRSPRSKVEERRSGAQASGGRPCLRALGPGLAWLAWLGLAGSLALVWLALRIWLDFGWICFDFGLYLDSRMHEHA